VTGEWRKVPDEDLGDMYCSTNTVRLVMSRGAVGGACRTYVGKKNVYRVLVGIVEGKRTLASSRYRWAFYIKIHFYVFTPCIVI
jgi:hypothetical protein